MNEKILITNIHRVIMVDKEEYPDKFTEFKSKRLMHNELIFHLSGEALVRFNGKELKTKGGTIRFLPACENLGYTVTRITAGECIDVFFDTNEPIFPEAFVMDMSRRENIAPLFKKMLCTWIAKEEGYYLECISIIYKILAEMQKSSYLPSGRYEKIKPAVELIQAEFLRGDISTGELTKAAGISEAYLKRLFHERFGVSPKRYIIQMKINHAQELLRLGQYSVSEVAYMCGYPDPCFFSRQFKKYTGISPSGFSEKYLSTK